MSHADKVEVMDFLINVLKDHEKSLDSLISRAEDVITERESEVPFPSLIDTKPVRIVLKNWKKFKSMAQRSDLICFDLINSIFKVSASNGPNVFQYREKTPDLTLEMNDNDDNLILSGIKLEDINDKLSLLNGKLSIGLELVSKKIVDSGEDNHKHRIIYELDSDYTKDWLSEQVGIDRDYILVGDIEL